MKTIVLQDRIEIIGGQIMTRIVVDKDGNDEVVETCRVLVPKCIGPDGFIDVSDAPEEQLKTEADPKKISRPGDIVMKLSPPYDAGIVTEASAGCVVPSFCGIFKCPDDIDVNYLLAFLNSGLCKDKLRAQVQGAVMTVLSVGKIKGISMPLPDIEAQRSIGDRFIKSQRKMRIIQQIIQLEGKRNDIVFRDLEASL